MLKMIIDYDVNVWLNNEIKKLFMFDVFSFY